MEVIKQIPWLFIFLAIIIGGWVSNVVTVANTNFNDLDGELIIRVIGIFVAPIGIVMGYI